MTLAARLMLAIGIVTVAATTALGLGVREAWSAAEERRFASEFSSAVSKLEKEIEREAKALPDRLRPACDHDPALDSVLVDLRKGELDPGRRLAIGLRVRETMKGLRVDELTLVTGEGEVLGSGHDRAMVGTERKDLAQRLTTNSDSARARTEAPVAFEAHCARTLGTARLGLVAARHLSSILEEVTRGEGVELRVGEVRASRETMRRAVRLEKFGGVEVVATRSRYPLRRALADLDATVFGLGAVTLSVALLVAWLLARGLARPIVSLAAQARRVVHETPEPVRGGGGRELSELADSFNRALSDLAALRKRLAATERIAARREIARRVAHEIKNPLMPIRTAVETLRRLRARDDPAFDSYFEEASRTVLDEVARITTIVREFTEFARLPPPRPEPMDLESVVRDVARLHEGVGPDIDIEVEVEALGEIQADRDQMVQVVQNLVQNALDAVAGAPGGRIALRLWSPEPEWVALTVTDNGPGVPAELRKRLFEPYATTKEKGTGLGLAIAHRIAVEHGGDLTYADAKGGGAEFHFTLPRGGPTLLPEPPPPSR